MKKQTNSFKNIFLLVLLAPFLVYGLAIAADEVAENISNQSSTGTGSSNSTISFITGSTSDPQYINVGNNSTVIGNYLSGSYYDSVYGFFSFKWDENNIENNVHISGSTDKCSSGYGYKIGGYAYSEYYGFIDFDYNDSTYVYYCLADNQMHGYAYSELIGFQNFEGIGFEIITQPLGINSDPSTNSGFTNSNTTVNNPNQNYQPNRIGGDIFKFKDTDESIFYIIK